MEEKKTIKTIIFAEQKKGKIHRVTYELLGKARELAGSVPAAEFEISAVVLGPSDLDVSEIIRHGADRVYHIAGDGFTAPDELLYKRNICALLEEIKPDIFLIGATTFGRSVAPRIAAALNTGLTADCTELAMDEDGKLIQIRPAFSDNILAHIKTQTLPQMATIRYKEFPEAERDESRTAEVIVKPPYVEANDLVSILRELTEEEFDISDAQIVVSGGKGLKSKEDMKLIRKLAEKLGGEVGASRAIVDEGYIGKAHQIGYSGNRVKAKLYVACGISGAPQHLAGMKESDLIVAINSDPSAPIFQVADYGIVGDLYQVIPMFLEQLGA